MGGVDEDDVDIRKFATNVVDDDGFVFEEPDVVILRRNGIELRLFIYVVFVFRCLFENDPLRAEYPEISRPSSSASCPALRCLFLIPASQIEEHGHRPSCTATDKILVPQ